MRPILTGDFVSVDTVGKYRSCRFPKEFNLRVLEVKEIKTVPYVPLSHPFVERLIGTIRREYLDQTLFWTAADLEEKLRSFQDYFNRHRVHSGPKLRPRYSLQTVFVQESKKSLNYRGSL